MEKPKILFVCPQPLWPTNTGARLRNFHLADVLCNRFDVTVLQAIDPTQPRVEPPANSFQTVLSGAREKSYTPVKILRGLIGPTSLTILNYFSKDIERVLLQELASARYFAVQFESIHMALYRRSIQTAPHSPRLLLDWHNIESELAYRFALASNHPAKKLVASRTAKLLAAMEEQELVAFSAHTVVSQLEKEKLLRRVPSARIHVVPNGVQVSDFARARIPSDTRRILLFVGSMDYHANAEAVVWFCRTIWPTIAKEFPQLQFKIVGRHPSPDVQALADLRIIVTGTVSDIQPYYQEALATIVPLRVGGGTRLKILESMAAGVPVISTRLGAEGTTVEDRVNILFAETADEMAAAIRLLINDPALAQRLQAAGSELVRNRYDWPVIGRQLAAVFDSLLTP